MTAEERWMAANAPEGESSLRSDHNQDGDEKMPDALDALKEYAATLPKRETAEEAAKREKRDRASRIIGAVSDGVRSLANLYFTTKGAPSMYDSSQSMYAAEDARIRQAKADRDANDSAWLNVALKADQLQTQRDALRRELEDREEAKERQRTQDEREAERFGWQRENQAETLREAKARADRWENEARYSDEYYSGRNDLQQERLQTEHGKQEVQRSQVRRNDRAGTSKSQVRHSASDLEVHTPDGKRWYIPRNRLEWAHYDLPDDYKTKDATVEEMRKDLAEFYSHYISVEEYNAEKKVEEPNEGKTQSGSNPEADAPQKNAPAGQSNGNGQGKAKGSGKKKDTGLAGKWK